jgi:acyl carrier protein
MVPSAITVLDKFPLTANGKLDRRALPDPELGADASSYVAPRTTTEELLVDIWRDVLAVERVGVEDNFFELGGHSLLATQVIARLHDTLGVELTMREFFFAPTVAGMSRLIDAALIEQIKADAAEPDRGAVLAAAKE